MPEYGLGLRIYPNSGFAGSQFVNRENTQTPYGDPQLQDVSGTPWGDTVVFTIRKPLWFNIQNFWQGVFTTGVTQRRVITGEIILGVQKYPCPMCRVCWDVRDKRTGGIFVETATGVVVLSSVEVRGDDETWQITLYRGEYLLDQLGRLVVSTRNCANGGGGDGIVSGVGVAT